jgi:hypothetical protein
LSIDCGAAFRLKRFRLTLSHTLKKDLPMRNKSILLSLVIGITIFGMACGRSKIAANMSDDEKHRLFQAAGITQDGALIMEASKKLGLADAGGQATPSMETFIKAHYQWISKNEEFVKEHMSKEKAMEYVKTHMP